MKTGTPVVMRHSREGALLSGINRLARKSEETVIPAQAGIHAEAEKTWIPAFAGMTILAAEVKP